MDNCPFCEVVAGESDSEPIAATDNSVAFYDRYPVEEGHALIIPWRLVSDLFDLDPNERID